MRDIESVVERLSEVVDTTSEQRDPAGYFAALYRTVTERVAQGIREGFFEDGPRMERLDVVFAQRYFDALEAWKRGEPTSQSWATPLAMTTRWRPIVLQHLLGGMNAHINLDLGIAAATVAPGSELAGLKGDFIRINQILASLVEGTAQSLAQIWRPLRLINLYAGPADDALVGFSMTLARDGAWAFAERLASLSQDAWPAEIEKRDRVIGTDVADLIYRPGMLGSALLWIVRVGERGSVPSKIAKLAAIQPAGPARCS